MRKKPIAKRILISIGLVGLFGIPTLYLANPTGTASDDPRARLLGYAIYQVPTDTNAPTIKAGDVVFVSTFAYMFESPKSGDLVAFVPPHDPRPWLNRAIGNPGDTVALKKGMLHVNGSRLEEPYVATENNTLAHDMPERIIPEGMLFVLGDNRDRSQDSRHFGFIPIENVIGRANGF